MDRRSLAALLGLCWALTVALCAGSPQFAINFTQVTQEDAGGDTELCGEALQSGQQVSLCNIVGKGYPLGSAADLLFATRFQKPDAAWPTTDRNVRAFMADYTLTLTREQSRLDAYKQIKGTAEV